MTASRGRRAKRVRAEEEEVVAGERVPRCRECGAIGTLAGGAEGRTYLFDHKESCGVKLAQDRMYSRQAPPNEYVRTENRGGVPIVSILRRDLTDAWRSYDKEVARHGDGTDKAIAIKGRIRGLAQALALIQSPYTRLKADEGEGVADWNRYVMRVMNEYRA
jgi:hypothetical protein